MGNYKWIILIVVVLSETFEDTKGVIIVRKPKRTDKTMSKRKMIKGQTTIYKTLHRKLKIEQHEPH